MARPSLPIELCERIIDASTYTLRFGDPTAIDYRTLRACALVCSAWLPRARHNLFFRVSVKSARGLRDLAAGAEACAWIRPREVQLTLPLRVSRPKGKGKGKGKGFKCNFKKQTPATPVVCGGNSFAQPASATKLRLGEQDSDEDDANISLVDPKVARVFSAVSTLTIVSSEWLFPQRYAALFGAQFSTENMRELRLYHVFFVTGRDLALLLWSFPALSAVECHCAIVKFGDASGRTGSGMGSWKLPPLPRRTGTVPPCAALRSLKMDSCSSSATLILRAATLGPANLTHVHIRSSFARWTPQDYAPLSTLVRLEMLEVVLASPTAYSPMPAGKSLIGLYRDTTQCILAALPHPCHEPVSLPPSPPQPPLPLKHLSFTYEPGYATRGELAGAVEWQGPGVRGTQGWGGEDDAVSPPHVWAYACRASDGMATLLQAGFEDMLCEYDESLSRGLKPAFANLERFTLRVWDPSNLTRSTGKDGDWWALRVRRGIPTLWALGVVDLDVKRDTWEEQYLLWDPEDFEIGGKDGQERPA